MTDDDDGIESTTSRCLSYLPKLEDTYSLWYKRRYMIVQREEKSAGFYNMRECLEISILSMDRSILQSLIDEARQSYKEAERKVVSVFSADTGSKWKLMTSRPKRPLSSIILEPGIKELLINDARDFLSSRKWYADRGIPFRRGYLLYGPPGTGKTSMIQSIAGELGLNVYIVTLSRAGMDDSSLNELISNMPNQCIALMEDIDAAITGVARDLSEPVAAEPPFLAGGSSDEKAAIAKALHNEGKRNDSQSRLSLSGLLNALDGIGAQEGRILFATTNNYQVLDPALCRPGRMDLHVEFKLASRYQAESLYKCFYMPEGPDDAADEHVDEGYESKRDSIDSDEPDSEPQSPSVSEDMPLLLLSPSASQQVTEAPRPPPFKTLQPGQRKPALPNQFLSHREALTLATRFSEAIPEGEMSMASLQGYLMRYKSRPREAVADAIAWVKKERAAKKDQK
ncbi:hypothetical protein EVJ58_g5236 [Rhodofomes roseus]|uniref:P-loop containing nucleoside triphosphate hydrolase protein n=1 Tax=Rhodofomes roseus TaxID=34475 RepID=A0A4Y9YCN5_9APHY|nr:hypothetical protein EVJ58_g5236 [Rhodofomes roseus]